MVVPWVHGETNVLCVARTTGEVGEGSRLAQYLLGRIGRCVFAGACEIAGCHCERKVSLKARPAIEFCCEALCPTFGEAVYAPERRGGSAGIGHSPIVLVYSTYSRRSDIPGRLGNALSSGEKCSQNSMMALRP